MAGDFDRIHDMTTPGPKPRRGVTRVSKSGRFDPAVVDYVQSVADLRGCPWVEALEFIITSTPGFLKSEPGKDWKERGT